MERRGRNVHSRSGQVLHALIRRLRPSRDVAQLALELASTSPRDESEMLTRLSALGLRGVKDVILTDNRRTMVSVKERTLRVHKAYLEAPPAVHQAIADFIMVGPRGGATRRKAERCIIEFASTIDRPPPAPRNEPTHPDDEPLAERLTALHARYNAECFEGRLAEVPIRISRRMKSRLGHYTARRGGQLAEIAISSGHFRRHGFVEVAHTLMHEMVHQWQDESGLPVDHGAAFKCKCREVGASPSATRRLR
jgi:hypothetical protein